MTFKICNMVKETTSTVGTGSYALDGAALGGWQAFDGALNSGDETIYVVTDGRNREVGIGTFTSGVQDRLSRSTILESTNNGAPVDWTGGLKTIAGTISQERLAYFSATPTSSDANKLIGVGAGGDGTGLIDAVTVQAPLTASSGTLGMTHSALANTGCRLVRSGPSQIKLTAEGGSPWLLIDGEMRNIATTIPLDIAGQTPYGQYFVYASWSGSNIVLELWNTANGYVITNDGIPVRGSEPSETLVGAVFCDGSGALATELDTLRPVSSWWNRKPIRLTTSGTHQINAPSLAPINPIPMKAWTWHGDIAIHSLYGTAHRVTPGQTVQCYFYAGVDNQNLGTYSETYLSDHAVNQPFSFNYFHILPDGFRNFDGLVNTVGNPVSVTYTLMMYVWG